MFSCTLSQPRGHFIIFYLPSGHRGGHFWCSDLDIPAFRSSDSCNRWLSDCKCLVDMSVLNKRCSGHWLRPHTAAWSWTECNSGPSVTVWTCSVLQRSETHHFNLVSCSFIFLQQRNFSSSSLHKLIHGKVINELYFLFLNGVSLYWIQQYSCKLKTWRRHWIKTNSAFKGEFGHLRTIKHFYRLNPLNLKIQQWPSHEIYSAFSAFFSAFRAFFKIICRNMSPVWIVLIINVMLLLWVWE